MLELRHPFHRMILEVFEAMDPDFLLDAECYFAGGGPIAMMCGEFRESRRMDFLCASRAGFRKVREAVSESSLGGLMRRQLPLARELRADRGGISAFFRMRQAPLKLAIALESRVDLKGQLDGGLMANADRGLDDSTRMRDLIDLAFLAERFGLEAIEAGMRLAEPAYGSVLARHLVLVLRKLDEQRGLLALNAESLGVTGVESLRRGIARLKKLRAAPPPQSPRPGRRAGSVNDRRSPRAGQKAARSGAGRPARRGQRPSSRPRR
jgi:hypothetical protein